MLFVNPFVIDWRSMSWSSMAALACLVVSMYGAFSVAWVQHEVTVVKLMSLCFTNVFVQHGANSALLLVVLAVVVASNLGASGTSLNMSNIIQTYELSSDRIQAWACCVIVRGAALPIIHSRVQVSFRSI